MIVIEDGKNLLTRLEGWMAPFDCFDNLGQGETDSAQFHQKRPFQTLVRRRGIITELADACALAVRELSRNSCFFGGTQGGKLRGRLR